MDRPVPPPPSGAVLAVAAVPATAQAVHIPAVAVIGEPVPAADFKARTAASTYTMGSAAGSAPLTQADGEGLAVAEAMDQNAMEVEAAAAALPGEAAAATPLTAVQSVDLMDTTAVAAEATTATAAPAGAAAAAEPTVVDAGAATQPMVVDEAVAVKPGTVAAEEAVRPTMLKATDTVQLAVAGMGTPAAAGVQAQADSAQQGGPEEDEVQGQGADQPHRGGGRPHAGAATELPDDVAMGPGWKLLTLKSRILDVELEPED